MAAAWASLWGAFGCALLALVLGSSGVDFGVPPASFYPRFNPFFFLCTHHAELDGVGVAEGGGEVLLTLQIMGNPTAYTPGQEYQGVSTLVFFLKGGKKHTLYCCSMYSLFLIVNFTFIF